MTTLSNPLINRVHFRTFEDYKNKGMDSYVPAVRLHELPTAEKVDLNLDDRDLARLGKEGILDFATGQRRGPLALDLPQLRTIREYFSKKGRNPTARKLARLETAASSQFQVHFTCSDLDSERLRNTMPDARLVTIPNGVDTEFFKPLNGPQRPNSLVFVGTMNWYPNDDAMMFMLRADFRIFQNEP